MSKPLVICCDHAIPKLAEAGVVPDACFAVDGSGFIWSDLYTGLPLITAITADPSLSYSWGGPVYFYGFTTPVMYDVSKPYLGDIDLLLDNCATVGGTLATFALWNFQPLRAHFFGFDYCWREPTKQHTLGLTYSDMERSTKDVRVMRGSSGELVRTYPGFWTDSKLLQKRVKQWEEETGGETNWFGETIVTVEEEVPQATYDENVNLINLATAVRLSNRWRGAAKANSLFPSKGNLRGLIDELKKDWDSELYLVGAGPSLDESIDHLRLMLNPSLLAGGK